MNHRLQIRDLHLSYGPHEVLRGVALSLHGGELVGLIGPNGAGKSSLLRCIAGLEASASGEVLINGVCVRNAPLAARQHVGLAVEPERLPPLLSGMQCLQLVSRLRTSDEALTESLELCETLGLSPWLQRRVGEYSLGTKQKLAIVLALIGAPALVVMDEVLNGLDPLAAFALKQTLRKHADRGACVLLATHGLEVAERFLDRALLLLDGEIAAQWGPQELMALRNDPSGGLEQAVVARLRAQQARR